MKKTITFLSLLLCVFSISAQQIEDGSFETKWTQFNTIGRGPYWDYSQEDEDDLFRTLNFLYEIPDGIVETALTAFRETDAQDGNYAIRVTSTYFENILFVPGVFGTISNDFVREFLDTRGITIVTEYGFKPTALKGYYKYLPEGRDSASIEIDLYNYDVRIGGARFVEYEPVREWTAFDVPLHYDHAASATHMRLIFVASAGYNFDNLEACKGNPGTSLIIDNVWLEFPNGLREPLTSKVKVNVYPNPASEVVKFDFEEAVRGKLVIYSMNGAEIGETTINDQQVVYNVSGLSSGAYLYRVIDGNTILSSGKFSVQ